MTTEEQAAEELKDVVQEATGVFFQQMEKRHHAGEEKYGPIKFMMADTLAEAMEEVVDLANYAMYTYIKLFLLSKAMEDITFDPTDPTGLGPNSFIPNAKR